MTNLDRLLKSRDITLLTKVHLVKVMVFSSSHVWIWKLDHKEGWAPKNWCFWTVVLEKTLESPLDCKEISPGCSLEGLMLKLQNFGHLMWRTNSLEKTPMLGKIEGRRSGRQRMMVGWYHQLNGHEFEQDPGVGDGQGSLECCSPACMGCKKLDMTERLNWKYSCLENSKDRGAWQATVHGVTKSWTQPSN